MKILFSFFFIKLLLLVSAPVLIAQEAKNFSGIVKNVKGESLIGAVVEIPALKKTAVTDAAGKFRLNAVLPGRHEVHVRYIGYKKLTRTVDLTRTQSNYTFILDEEKGQLAEVIVKAKTGSQLVREQPIKAEVINTKAIQEQPTTIVELMNRSAGIRVR